jgi:NADH-quinone oxidoreductase subunit J
MLLGGEQVHQKEDLPWQRILAVTLGVILLGEFVYTLTVGQAGLPGLLVSSDAPAPVDGMAFGSPIAIGDSLFKQYVLPFEVTAILLLVAMIGAIVITQKRR